MKHPVPERHLTYIGDIVVSYALLESAIQGLIGSLIYEHQRIGQIITSELSFKVLCSMASSLFVERHGRDDDYKKLKEMLKSAIEIDGIRNNIVHSIWGAGRDRNTITRIKMAAKQKIGFKVYFEELSLKDLETFVKRIKECAKEIQDLHFVLITKGKAISNPVRKIW